jgi:hypothetical protein
MADVATAASTVSEKKPMAFTGAHEPGGERDPQRLGA